jgi:hypothetical protein
MPNLYSERFSHCGIWFENSGEKMTGTNIWMLSHHWKPTNTVHHSFISYRTGQYKLHYYETMTNIKFVMLTDTQSPNMRNVLHQIYVNLYVEFGNIAHSICEDLSADMRNSGEESAFSSRTSWGRRRCKRIIRIGIGSVR